MTTNLIDIQNSDVIMATTNMAENHPVGFQWVMKAKERGAKFIHVDPRFTRTSAVADIHVPLRSGTNIAFFGGLISYAIQNNLYFKDYVVHYTNASFLIDPAFKTADRRRRPLHRARADRQGRHGPARRRDLQAGLVEVPARRRGQSQARPHAQGSPTPSSSS